MPSPDSASALADVQQALQAALMAPGADAWARLQAHIAPGPRLSAAQHLAIYQRGYRARLLQCMQGQFKALSHALGAELFSDFAAQYLAQTPSRSATLALLGHGFAAWLQQNRPDAEAPEAWIDFMVDLAEFEWALYTLFDAPGAEDAGYASAAQLDDRALALQPCLRLGHYRYPVSVYYQQVAAQEAQGGDDPALPPAQPSWLALVRTDYRIGIFTLLPAQHHLLAQLQAGTALPDALRETARAFGKSLETVEAGWARWRTAWAAAGFFAKPAPG